MRPRAPISPLTPVRLCAWAPRGKTCAPSSASSTGLRGTIRPLGGDLETNGIYGVETENMVRKFQEIFNLTVDGIVGKATWYQIKAIYNAVKGLGELVSEGIRLEEVERVFSKTLRRGDTGNPVRDIQYYLAVISFFDDRLPQVLINGTFDEATEQAVRLFQEPAGPDCGRHCGTGYLECHEQRLSADPAVPARPVCQFV